MSETTNQPHHLTPRHDPLEEDILKAAAEEHFARLHDQGFIRVVREGRIVRLELTPEGEQELARIRLAKKLDRRLGRLAKALGR